MGFALHNIGFVYYGKDNLIKAKKYFSDALEIRREIKDQNNIGVTLALMGEVNRKLGNESEAIEYGLESYELRKKIGDRHGISVSTVYLGDLYLELGHKLGLSERERILKAEEYGKEGLKLAKEIGFVEQIQTNSRLLKKVYKVRGDYKRAFEMFEQEVRMRDSIMNEKNIKESENLRLTYEYERQKALDKAEYDKEIALTETREEKERFQKYVIGGMLVLVTLFLLFVYNRLKITRQQKQMIEEQNARMSDMNEELHQQNEEILSQRDQLEEIHKDLSIHHKEISDSINYAKRIQSAVMP